MVLVKCKNEEDPFKNEMKALEWSQDFSNYKWGFFSNAQGQLTPKSLVRSGRISTPLETLCLSLLSARMKDIQSKIQALELSQDYSLIF